VGDPADATFRTVTMLANSISGFPLNGLAPMVYPETDINPLPVGGGPDAGGADDTRPGGKRSPELAAALVCLRRIRRWRVPPRWSGRDWLEEIGAEATAAALQAWKDFDPDRGVPRAAFLRQRVLGAALARYRREWSLAIRQVSLEVVGEYGSPGADGLPSREEVARLVLEALGRLPRTEAWIIEGLFWGGKTEAGLAATLGVTQQAVSKRKRAIFRTLHRLIETVAKDLESEL
jgi:hypothetical protein